MQHQIQQFRNYYKYALEVLNNIMIQMITIKVQFQGKLINLGKNITQLSTITEEIKSRFPEQFCTELCAGIAIKYKEDFVTSFQNLLDLAKKDNKTSVKVKALKLELVCQNSNFKKIVSQCKKESSIKEELNQKVDKFYICYLCEGQGTNCEKGQYSVCQVCDGNGKIYSQHKLFKFIENIVSQKLQEGIKKSDEPQKIVKKQENCEEKEKKQTQSQEKPQKKETLKKSKNMTFEVQTALLDKRKEQQIGTYFNRNFLIKNSGSQNWPQSVYIYDIDLVQKIRKIEGLKAGQSKELSLGSYQCDGEVSIQKRFVLCFQEEENGDKSLIRFGNIFGFVVKGVEKLELKKIDSPFETQVKNALELFSNQKKSFEYYMQKLFSMGINQGTELDDEDLIELIQQLEKA